MKKFFKEFGEFISKGNVLDLAVGVIIGAAFKDIVTSLTDNLIRPLLDVLIRTGDKGATFTVAGIVFNYGAFLTSVINFLIMAFVVFIIVKAVKKAQDVGKKIAITLKLEEEDKPKSPTTKICPFCKSEISIEATRCPHCTSHLEE